MKRARLPPLSLVTIFFYFSPKKQFFQIYVLMGKLWRNMSHMMGYAYIGFKWGLRKKLSNLPYTGYKSTIIETQNMKKLQKLGASIAKVFRTEIPGVKLLGLISFSVIFY